MNHVIVYGSKKDRQIGAILQQLLAQYFDVTYMSENCAIASNGTFPHKKGVSDLILIETESLEELNAKNGILIVKSDAVLDSLHYLDKSTNVIVNSGSSMSTHSTACSGIHLPYVYTCGFSSKDYVTFSSRDDDHAVVSLQRGIRIPDMVSLKSAPSPLTEPFELPCTGISDIENYSVLSSILTLILLGAIDENKSKEIGKICFSY